MPATLLSFHNLFTTATTTMNLRKVVTITAAVIALVGFQSAKADRVFPHFFATQYCTLRSSGLDHYTALRGALADSAIESDSPDRAVRRAHSQSFKLAAIATGRACPQYMNAKTPADIGLHSSRIQLEWARMQLEKAEAGLFR